MNKKVLDLQYKILDNSGKKIKQCIHASDIHIRHDRFDEYRHVFQNLYDELKSRKISGDETVIVICGDIIHCPKFWNRDSILLFRSFIYNLLSYADIIIIPGNHDMSIANPTQNNLKSLVEGGFDCENKVYLLFESGLYLYNNIMFGHTAINSPNVIECNIKLPSQVDYKIALYHGTIIGSMNENGLVNKNAGDRIPMSMYDDCTIHNNNCTFKVADFKNAQYDFCYFGDVHRYQVLNATTGYPSSLIQQNIGEDMYDHGVILWNLKKKSHEYIRIKNKYVKIKVKINPSGEYKLPKLDDFEYLDLVVDCESRNEKDYENILKDISLKKINVGRKECIFTIGTTSQKIDTCVKIDGEDKDLTLKNVNVKEVIIKYIEDLLKKENKSLTQKEIDEKMVDYKKTINDIVFNEDTDSNKVNDGTITLNKLTFSGIGPYGKFNCIDFSKFDSITGIYEDNNVGKSWIIDVILFSIFGKCTRFENKTPYDIINSNYHKASSSIHFTIGDDKYNIERHVGKNSKENKNSQMRETIIIFKNNVNITPVINNKKTINEYIEKTIYSYDNFLVNFVMVQNKYKHVFSTLSPAERKDRIVTACKFEKFNNFMTCFYNKSKSAISDCTSLEKRFKISYGDYGDKIDDVIINMTKFIDENKQSVDLLTQQLLKIKKEIVDVTKNIGSYEEKINNYGDIKQVTRVKKNDIVNMEKELVKKNDKLNNTQNTLNDMGTLEEITKKYNDEKSKNIKKLKKEINTKKEKIFTVCMNDNDHKKYIESDMEDDLINDIKKIENDNKNKKIRYDKNVISIEKIDVFLNKKINKVDKKKVDTFNNKKNDMILLNEKIKIIANQISDLNEELDNICDIKINKKCKSCVLFEKIKFDEKCDSCIAHSSEARKLFLQNKIDVLANDLANKRKEFENVEKYLEKNKGIVEEYDEYNKYITEKNNYSERKNILMEQNKNILENIKNNDTQIKNAKSTIDNHKKYDDYLKIMCDIEKLNDKLISLENEKCEDVEAYNKLSDDVKIMTNEIGEIKTNLLELKNNNKKYEEYFVLIDSVKELNDKYDDLINDSEEISRRISINNKKITEVEHDMDKFKKEYDSMKKIIHDSKVFTELNVILKNKVIVDELLQTKVLPKINLLMSEYYKFFSFDPVKLVINSDGSDVKRGIIIENVKKGTEITFEGGFFNALFDIIYKLVFATFSCVNVNFFICDEVFDAADSKNVNNMIKLIKFIKNKYKWCLLISHSESIVQTYDHRLKIDILSETEKKVNYPDIEQNIVIADNDSSGSDDEQRVPKKKSRKVVDKVLKRKNRL